MRDRVNLLVCPGEWLIGVLTFHEKQRDALREHCGHNDFEG